MALFVGVDLGGTTSTIAIGNEERRVVRVSAQFPTRSAEGPEVTIGDIVAGIAAQLEELSYAPADVTSICLASPGPATIDGVLLQSPNLRAVAWNRCPLRQRLEQAFAELAGGVPVTYIGDGQAAALGEYAVRRGHIHWAAAQNAATHVVDTEGVPLNSMFMFVVGTGLGGGEVRDGRTVRGNKGRAGHAGHLMLPADAFRYEHDRQLKVGNAYSTTESAISLTALTHQLGYRLSLDQWREHVLNRTPGSDRDKAKRLRELAASGDPLALELFDDQANALGIALLMVQYIGDYDLLVIGGGICDITADLRRRYIEVAKKAYDEHALDGFRDSTNVSFSVCGDHAPVIGALFESIRCRL